MRVTIIKDDNTVLVDGVRQTVDCASLSADFHALQWDGTHGEVEYNMTRCTHCGARSKKGNELISSIAPYQKFVDAWAVAKAEADEAARVAAEELAKQIAAAEAAHAAAETEALQLAASRAAPVDAPNAAG